jgi:hypothetical protein
MSDDDLLEAAEWQLDGFPAMSRDRRHIATVFQPSSGYRAIIDEANPNFDEPEGVAEYPNWYLVVLDAASGATERRDVLVEAEEFELAQNERSKAALATVVRERLRAVDRAVAAGGYQRMASAPPSVIGDVDLDGWSGEPLPMPESSFTCLYTPRAEQVAVDDARAIAVVLVAQSTYGGDACAGAANADRKLKVLRLGQ